MEQPFCCGHVAGYVDSSGVAKFRSMEAIVEPKNESGFNHKKGMKVSGNWSGKWEVGTHYVNNKMTEIRRRLL